MSDTNNNSKSKFLLRDISTDDLELMAKMQGIAFDLVKAFQKIEEELLVKVYEQYTGDKVEFKDTETLKRQGARITIGVIEDDVVNYKLSIDGIHVGNVERDFINGAINFTPINPLEKFTITDDGIKLAD